MNRPRCHYCDTTGDMLNDVRYREELDVDVCDRCAETVETEIIDRRAFRHPEAP